MADPSGNNPGGPDPRVAQEIARAMQAVRDNTVAATRAFEDQLRIVTQLRDAMQQMSSIDMTKTGPSAQSAADWQKVTNELNKSRKASDTTTESLKKASVVMQSKFAKAAIVGASALSGLGQGFRNLYALTKSVGSFFGSVVSGATKVAKSIIAIPFTMINKLFSMAQSGGGSNELAVALEEVRAQFGDLNSTASQTVIQGARSMEGFAGAGISALRVFGNVAERMKLLNKLAGDLGPLFLANIEKFKGAEGAILGYQKGLGLTNEMMSAVTVRAQQMGTGVTDVLNDMTKLSLGMAKSMGLNAKVLSRDMGKAMQDSARFGHLLGKEIAANAAYAQKLGVSLDKLTALMDKFETFDEAAESTSKLNEQFGLNIDAQEIMSAQSPGAKLDILRKQFAATGKDLKDLTYQERKLIAANTGLDASTLDTVLAQEKAGVSFDEMTSASESAEKKQLSQTEAMHELATAMERITQSGGGEGGGIFAHIFRGFARGVQSNKEFIGLMRNINIVMREATIFGVKLGKMFVDLFPGVKDIFGGLKDMFDPKRFRKMFDGVLKAFDVFKVGGSGKMEDFMDNIKKVFTNFFDEGAPAGKKVLEGFKKFFKAMLNVVGAVGAWLVPKLSEIIVKITDWIRNPKVPKVSTDGLGNVVMSPMEKALEAVKEKLVPALEDLASAIWDRLKQALMSSIGKKALAGAALTVLAPALLNGLLGASSAGIFSSAGKLIVKGLTGGLAAEDAGAVKDIGLGLFGIAKKVTSNPETMAKISGQFAKFGEILGPQAMKAIPVVGWALAIGDAAINISAATKKFGDVLQKEGLDPATANIAAGATGIINALTFGLIPDDLQKKMAISIGKISDSLFKSLDKFFGPGFSASIKDYLSSAINVFGGLGDLLTAIWNGDSKGVNAAFIKIGKSLMGMIKSSIEMAANVVLKLGPLVIEYLFKAEAWISNKIGDIFLSLKDIPLIGPIFEWIGNGFKYLGRFFTEAGQAFKLIGDIMKRVNVTQMLRDIGDSILQFADNAIKNFQSIKDAVFSIFKLETFSQLFDKLVQGIKNVLGKLADVGPFKAIIDIAKKVFKIESPSKVFEDIGDNINSGLNKSLADMPKDAQKHFDKTVDAAKNMQNQTLQQASGSTLGGEVAPATATPAVPDVDAMKSTLKKLLDLGDLAKNMQGTGNKLYEFNMEAKNIASSMSQMPKFLEPILNAVVSVRQILEGNKTKASATENITKVKEFFDGVDGLGTVCEKIGKENLGNKFWMFNDAAAHLTWHLSHVPENLQPVVEAAKRLTSLITADAQKTALDSVTRVTGLLTSLTGLGEAGQLVVEKKLKEKIEGFNGAASDIASKLSELPRSLKSITDGLTGDTFKNIPVQAVQKSIEDFKKIIATIQQVDDALTNAPKVNLSARLGQVAGQLGIGSSGVYTVKSKEVVINMTLNVTMDAGAVENAIITNKKSIIRDRINFFADNTTYTGADVTPEKGRLYSNVPPTAPHNFDY